MKLIRPSLRRKVEQKSRLSKEISLLGLLKVDVSDATKVSFYYELGFHEFSQTKE